MEAAVVMNVLRQQPPRIVVIDPEDRNNSSYSNEMIAYVRSTYRLVKTVSNFEIYRAS
jgi:endo-alpha-1,4-polygalactosaminidase (GH114 family)